MFHFASDLYNQVVEAAQKQELWERSRQNQERMKSDVPLRFGFILSELWKPNKTRSCGKEATQTRRESMQTVQKYIDVPLRFEFVLSELWKPDKNRSCGKEAIQNQENPCRLLLHKRKNEIRCSTPPRICIKRVVEAKQNQELWERSHTKPGENQIKNEIRYSASFRICIKRVVENQQLWERSQQTRRESMQTVQK